MTEQEVSELAAILVDEHGDAALNVAERRREQFAYKPKSPAFRLWSRIAAAVARRLPERDKAKK